MKQKTKGKKGADQIRVVELFAGVGGFHEGLSRARGYEVVWANQWEPSTKKQHAFEVYARHFPESVDEFSNVDIARAVKEKRVPDHDLLVGGFPCQDYSVARTLSHAAGIDGKKGVLWWSIVEILRQKGSKAPKFLMLENVDRLLKSPVSQRGRDFAIMLASLADLGYAVEWRVINAADYGEAQRRRRTYIMGYKKGSEPQKAIAALKKDVSSWALKGGIMAKAFPILKEETKTLAGFNIKGDLSEITKDFNREDPSASPFGDVGVMIDREVRTWKTKPKFEDARIVLGDIIEPEEKEVPEEYFIKESALAIWRKLKGGKREERKSKGGFSYTYSEGPVAFPDPLDKPSRTIVTGEGGPTPSRFKHVIKTKSGRYRRLMPEELEELNGFKAGHTAGMPDARRAFFMGNALVVGVIEKLGTQLRKF